MRICDFLWLYRVHSQNKYLSNFTFSSVLVHKIIQDEAVAVR